MGFDMDKHDFRFFVFCFVFTIATIGFAILFEVTACRQKSVSFEKSSWGIFSGCMVKHNDRWIPLDNIRGFDDKG